MPETNLNNEKGESSKKGIFGKFKESVDISVRLGIDPKKSDQNVDQINWARAWSRHRLHRQPPFVFEPLALSTFREGDFC